MSHVDNWLLLLNLGEEVGLAQVNAILSECDLRQQQFRLLDEKSWGGAKAPEVEVYGMAANHLTADLVLDAIKSVTWHDPEMSALAYRQQDGGWQFSKLDDLIDRREPHR